MRFRSFFALLSAFLVLSAGVYALGAQSPTELAKAIDSGELFRLHIIANSDSDEDQGMKLAVRDAVLLEFEDDFEDISTLSGVTELIEGSYDRIMSAVKNAGYAGAVSLSVGEYDFPDRVYGDTLVPAGRYHALRITLGEGDGQNWWCVMYPPLCFTKEGGLAMQPKNVKFRSFFASAWQKLWQTN